MSTNIGEATVRIRPETSGFAAEARRGTTRGLARVGAAVGATLVAGGALRAISQQIGAAGQLQTQLREVNTLTGLVGPAAERSFNQFTRGVAGLSRELGVAQQELTGGLYQAISAGVPRGNAIDFLRIATRAGIAGVTDTETAVDGLTTVINAFGLEAADVERVSDTLFQAVRGGKTTFDELAASLFQVAPVAANAGVDIQTVSAALATLTAQGTPTAVATTQLRQAIQSLIAPSVEAERRLLPVFRDAGFESGQAALAALGLERTLRLVADAADGDATTLQRLVGSTEALQAVLGLTGQGAGKFTAELAAQEDAAGATSKALAEIEKSAGRSFQRAGNAARNFGLLVGDAAAPAAARLADGLEEALNRASESAGFRRGVAGIADSIADGLTSPETLATLATLGTTGAAAFGAVNQAATATAPILRETLQLIGGIAGSSFGAPLLIGALAFRTLGGAAALALPRIQALRAAQAASATAATAAAAQQAAAARASVSAIGLVGPSSARAAAQATTGFSRASIAARGLGTGLLALSGGPVGATVLGLSAVAAGAFILSQRQSLAEQSTARFNDSLREQQDAASGAAAALNRVKDATSALAQSRVGVDQARQGVEQARADVQAVRAAPASQFGGEAQQRQALADATNRLRAAELGLRDARRANAQQAQTAVNEIQGRVAAEQASAEATRRSIATTTAFGRSGQQVAQVTATNRTEAIRYAVALRGTVQQQLASSRSSRTLSGEIRQQIQATDQSTGAGKQAVAALREQLAASQRTAQVTRARGLAEARAAEQTERAIITSKNTSRAEKDAARERLATVRTLAGQLRTEGRKAGEAIAEGQARGQRAKKGEQRKAGEEGGQAAAQGASGTAGEGRTAGETVGTAIGSGMATGIASQQGAVITATQALIAAARARAEAAAEVSSPSKVFARIGADMGRGVAVGVQSQQETAARSTSNLVARAVASAGRAGVANARTQGARIAGSLAEGFRVRGGGFRATITTSISAALRDSVVAAQGALQGFGQQVAELAGRAIESSARDFTPERAALSGRSAALDAASAADEERRIRDSIRLAEAGQEAAQRRLQSFEAAIARRTPEQDARLSPLQRERERQRLEELRRNAADPAREQRLELERFLLQRDEARLSAEEQAASAATQVQRAALDQQIADLVANLNARRITYEQFNAGVNATLAANGVNVAAAGIRLGTAFADQFNTALASLGAQGAAVRGGPALPAGFLAGIERPAQVALQEAVTTRNVLRSAFAAELARVRDVQRNTTASLRQKFEEEGSAGGRRIVASERRQLEAQETRHKQQLKELRQLNQAFLNQPPSTVIEALIVQAPGTDPAQIAAAIARAQSRQTASRARR